MDEYSEVSHGVDQLGVIPHMITEYYPTHKYKIEREREGKSRSYLARDHP